MTATELPGVLALPGSRAVLIGTARHSSGSILPDVPAASRTVRDLQQTLVSRCGIAERNMYPLIDPTTPQVVADVLNFVSAEATDTLLVYYVGHGLVDLGNELYLATAATVDLTRSVPAYQALPYAVLAQVIRHSRARSVVIVLDCCFANRAHGVTENLFTEALDSAQRQGVYLLAAAEATESAWAGEGQAHTELSGELIRLLVDGDPAGPPVLTLDHIYRRLATILPERGAPRPRRQASDRGDALVLAPNPAHRPAHGRALPTRQPLEELSPYPGLRAFTPEDTRFFFGREAMTARLVQRLAESNLLPVLGMSGVGKSSLLRAGLLPALPRLAAPGGGNWRWSLFTPHFTPCARLAEQLAAAARMPGPTLLVVDQFEALFAWPDAEASAFIARLTAACASGSVRAVLGVRADFYGRLAAYPELRPALERPFVVGAMTPGELRSAIEGPARAAGLALDDGLTELLMQDLGVEERAGAARGGLLPLLSYALLATWQHREGDRLTLAGYRATGGIGGAIAKTADDTFHRLDPVGQRAASTLLLTLVRVAEDNQHTRRHVPLAELLARPDAAVIQYVLDALTRARLVTVDDDGVEITHEALIRAWPRLRGWIDRDRAGLLVHQQLHEDAAVWARHDHDPAFLYLDTRLADARTLAREHGALDPLEQRFLAACERRQRRRSRQRRLLTSVLALISALAIAASVVAANQRADAEQQRDTAVSRAAASQVITVINTDPGLAAQLGLAAYRYSPTLEARSALLSASALPQVGRLLGHRGAVGTIATSLDGKLLATASADGTVRLWNLTTRGQVGVLPAPNAVGVAISPDDRTLYLAANGSVGEWNIHDPAHPVSLTRLRIQGRPQGIAEIAPLHLLVVASSEAVTVWDVSRPTRPTEVDSQRIGAINVVAGADGVIATEDIARHVQLWHLASGTLTPLATLPGTASALAMNPSGTALAVGDAGTETLWNILVPTAPMLVRTGPGRDPPAISPDGKVLASGSDKPLVTLAGAATGLPLAAFPQPEALTSLGFAADGREMITGSIDGTVRVWSTATPTLSNAGPVTGAAFSPNGRVMAATGADGGGVQLWDSADPARPVPLGSPLPGPARSVAFSLDGTTLAVGGAAAVQLWNIRDPRAPQPIGTALPGVADTLAFNRDGTLLAGGSPGSPVVLWNVRAGSAAPLSTANGPVVFAGDTLITAGQGDTLLSWDTSRPDHPVATIATHHTGLITALAYDPARRLLATASADKTVRVWQVGGPRRIEELGGPLTGHSSSVTALAFDAAAATLLSAGLDGTLMVWDLHDPGNGSLYAALFSSSALTGLTAVAVHPNGHTVVVGSGTSAVVGDVDPETVARRICTTSGSPLTTQEWSHYFQSLPYREYCP